MTENPAERIKQHGWTEFRQYFDRERINAVNDALDTLSADLLSQPELPNDVFLESGKIKQIQYLHRRGEIFANLLDDILALAGQLDIWGNKTKDMTGGSESSLAPAIEPAPKHELAPAIEPIKMSEFTIINMQLFEKHPEVGKHTRAHQDNAYFRFEHPLATTFWISLDDIDEENGCLYYAREFTGRDILHTRYAPNTTFRLRSGVPGLSLCIHDHPVDTDIPIVTAPGDVLLHNCLTVHRAGCNQSIDRRRRAIGVAIVPNWVGKSTQLESYYGELLRHDIELQREKNPKLYAELKSKYIYGDRM